MKIPNPLKPDDNSDNSWVSYLGLGTQLAASVVLMALIGIWLDGKFGTRPILTVVLSFVGIIGGMYNFIKYVLKSNNK